MWFASTESSLYGFRRPGYFHFILICFFIGFISHQRKYSPQQPKCNPQMLHVHHKVQLYQNLQKIVAYNSMAKCITRVCLKFATRSITVSVVYVRVTHILRLNNISAQYKHVVAITARRKYETCT